MLSFSSYAIFYAIYPELCYLLCHIPRSSAIFFLNVMLQYITLTPSYANSSYAMFSGQSRGCISGYCCISIQLHSAPQLRSYYPPNTFSICSYYILPSSSFHSFLGVHQQRNFQHNSQTFKPGVATRHYTPQYNGLKSILKEHFFIYFC